MGERVRKSQVSLGPLSEGLALAHSSAADPHICFPAGGFAKCNAWKKDKLSQRLT